MKDLQISKSEKGFFWSQLAVQIKFYVQVKGKMSKVLIFLFYFKD